MRSIELFAGGGGLALGTSNAGFRHEAVIEWDEDACNTIRENQRRGLRPPADWPEVVPTDVTRFDFSGIKEDLELMAGGVPCQPWSLGGKHKGHRDDRNLFPATVKIIRALGPKAVIIENVKGLTRKAFHNYYQYIQHQLRYPEIEQRENESWTDHLRRLQQHHTSGSTQGLHYFVEPYLANAANFGVPQRRERVFIVAFRSDLGVEWRFPNETHSEDALIYQKYVTGEYWDRVGQPRRKTVPERLRDARRQARDVSARGEALENGARGADRLTRSREGRERQILQSRAQPWSAQLHWTYGQPIRRAREDPEGGRPRCPGWREHACLFERTSTVFYGSRSGSNSDLPRRIRLPLVVD